MLTRLQSDDKAESCESDEKDDMNRRAGKTASRIPTFNKRPTASSGAEQHATPRRDSPEVGGHEPVAKPKPQDGRSLQQPSVRLPKVGLEASLPLSSTSLSSPSVLAASYLMSATPRPSLRGQPEEEKQLETPEADSEPDVTLPHLPSDSFFDEVEREEPEEQEKGGGDLTRLADIRPAAVAVEAIIDEEPPWRTRRSSVPELKDSQSSSDVEREDELARREGDGDAQIEEEKKGEERQENQQTSLNVAEPQKKPAGALSSDHSTKVSFSFLFLTCFPDMRKNSTLVLLVSVCVEAAR